MFVILSNQRTPILYVHNSRVTFYVLCVAKTVENERNRLDLSIKSTFALLPHHDRIDVSPFLFARTTCRYLLHSTREGRNKLSYRPGDYGMCTNIRRIIFPNILHSSVNSLEKNTIVIDRRVGVEYVSVLTVFVLAFARSPPVGETQINNNRFLNQKHVKKLLLMRYYVYMKFN